MNPTFRLLFCNKIKQKHLHLAKKYTIIHNAFFYKLEPSSNATRTKIRFTRFLPGCLGLQITACIVKSQIIPDAESILNETQHFLRLVSSI